MQHDSWCSILCMTRDNGSARALWTIGFGVTDFITTTITTSVVCSANDHVRSGKKWVKFTTFSKFIGRWSLCHLSYAAHHLITLAVSPLLSHVLQLLQQGWTLNLWPSLFLISITSLPSESTPGSGSLYLFVYSCPWVICVYACPWAP